jgi:hypothetical protein
VHGKYVMFSVLLNNVYVFAFNCTPYYGKVEGNSGLVRLWKEAIIACLKVGSLELPGKT